MKQNTDMESHEEKLHKMIIQSKTNDTKDVIKRKAIETAQQQAEALSAQLKTGDFTTAAKAAGLDNARPRTPEGTTPTTFRQWCEEVLRPAVLG